MVGSMGETTTFKLPFASDATMSVNLTSYEALANHDWICNDCLQLVFDERSKNLELVVDPSKLDIKLYDKAVFNVTIAMANKIGELSYKSFQLDLSAYKRNPLYYEFTRKAGEVVAKIESISVLGEVTIKFDRFMILDEDKGGNKFNKSSINSKNTVLYVGVTDVRMNEADFDASLLNLTWHVTEFYNDTMKIQLVFDNPLLISPLIYQDMLIVFFDRSYNMLSNKPTPEVLAANSIVLKHPIRKQMVPGELSMRFLDTSQILETSLKFLLLFMLLFQFCRPKPSRVF